MRFPIKRIGWIVYIAAASASIFVAIGVLDLPGGPPDRGSQATDVMDTVQRIVSVLQSAEMEHLRHDITNDLDHGEFDCSQFDSIPSKIDLRGHLTHDDPRQQPRVNQLLALVSERLAGLRDPTDLSQRSRREDHGRSVEWDRHENVLPRIEQAKTNGSRQFAIALIAMSWPLYLAVVVVGVSGVARERVIPDPPQESRNIHDVKRVEEKLRESEPRFRGLFDQTFQFINLLSPDGVILEANQATLTFTGLSRDTIIGKPAWESPLWNSDAETQERLREYVAAAAAGNFVRYEFDFGGASGQAATIDFSLKPLRDDNSSVSLIIAGRRDISERKDGENALARMNDELRRQAGLIDAAHDAILLRTIEGEISFWNQGAERMYGWKKNDAIGVSSHTLLQTRFPEPIDQILHMLVATGSWEGELGHTRADGTTIVVASRWVIDRDRRGTGSAVIEINHDITERRRAEAEAARERHLLAEISANGPVAIAMFDTEMRYLADSARWINEYGLTEHSLLGRSHYDIFPGLPGHWATMFSRCLAGETLSQAEEAIERHGGAIDFVRWAVHPWRNEDGKIGGIVMATDTINELVSAREAALETSRLKSEFLANMSHEIRTPMNGVIGMTSLLWKTDLDPAQKEYVATIRDSGQSLLSIINDVLDFSKIESGKVTLEVEDFNLRLIMDEVVDLLRPIAKAKNLLLECHYPPMLEWYEGDAGRIRQVLLNLVSNAVKFAEHGVVIRSAGVVARCVNRSTLRLSVRDTGDGIAIDRQAVIFESFTQADGSISRRYGGTGLGLSICRQLAGLMEGQIALASESGRGSEFRLELTLPERSGPHSIPGTKSISESPESVTTGPPAEPDRWRGVRVLVAEDNKTNQKVALRILDRLGCQADAVSNGREAVEMLDRVTYNLVLMDIQMPEMDGYHATAEIRRRDAARGGRLRVIAMTAHAMHGDRERCLAAGMDDYISKPVTYDMLAALLDRSCSASLSTRELTRGVPAREEHKPQILRFGRLREISAGDVKCEREMLQSFLQQTAASLIEFRSAFAQSDAVRIAGLAHSLLGACRTIGADSLAILCTDLEERSSKGKLPPYRRTLANLEREYLDLKATIMSYTEIIAPCVHSCDN